MKKYSNTNQESPQVLMESMAPYYTNKSMVDIEHFFDNTLQVNNTVQQGVNFSLFENLLKYIYISENTLADILSLSNKSIQRYKKEENFRFKPIHSEKLIELSEVANIGIKLFGTKEKFNHWLNTPSYVFENQKPVNFLNNSYGIKLILEELNRIEYGIFI